MPDPGEDIQSWSPVASNNDNADPGINWLEHMPRADVNNSARNMMAAVAKDRNLKNGSIVTSGTVNAQIFASGVGYITVPTGLEVLLKIGPDLTNTGTTTLNMDGIGVVTIKTQRGNDLTGGEIRAGTYCHFLYDGTNWIFLDLGITNTTVLITQVTVIDVGGGGTPVALLDFTDLDTTAYRDYQIVCTNVVPEINDAMLVVNISTDNGVTFPIDGNGFNAVDAWNTQGQVVTSALPYTFGSSQNEQGYLAVSWVIDTSEPGFGSNIILDLYGFEDDVHPTFAYRATHYHTGSYYATYYRGHGHEILVTGANAIRLWMSEGNIASGTFSLYGVPL